MEDWALVLDDLMSAVEDKDLDEVKRILTANPGIINSTQVITFLFVFLLVVYDLQIHT